MTSESLGNGAIFTCARFSFSLIWNKNLVFVCDSHGRERNGCHFPNRQSVFLQLRSVEIFGS